MPARRLDGVPSSVSQFDAIGQYAEGDSNLVQHIGMSNEDRVAVKAGDAVCCAHMVPPLQDSEFPVQVWGAAELSHDERRLIQTYLDSVRSEYHRNGVESDRLGQYVAIPHMMEVPDEMGRTLYRKYSCVGLVVETFRSGEIDLIRTDEEDLPEVPKNVIEAVVPRLRGTRTIGKIGLDPALEAWRVLMPGYVFHALARYTGGDRPAPYRPEEGDWIFP